MRNWNWLSEHFELGNPLEYMRITQPFGANEVDFYKKLGMLGHNGLDLRASKETPVYACFDGEVVYADEDGSGGRSVRIRSHSVRINGKEYKLEAIYYHLEKWQVSVGEKVVKGTQLGLSGNSGKYTTGPHLHWGLKPLWFENGQWQKDYSNGYFGAIDPEPFLTAPDWDRLPVDDRYGRKKDWPAEFRVRFKNRWLHRQFYNTLKRHPLSITDRELKALVYGGWDFETVFLDPAMYVNWTVQKKTDYLQKKPRPKPFDVNPWKL